jgi:hypothetical protein
MSSEIYNDLIRPFAPFFIVVLLAWLSVYLFGERITSIVAYLGQEFRSIFKAKPSLKALNAFGLLGIFVVVMAFGVSTTLILPGEDANSHSDELNVGAKAFYLLIFLIGLIVCLVLTKSEGE